MRKQRMLAAIVAAVIINLFLFAGVAVAQTTPNAADLGRRYNALQAIFSALPRLPPGVAPTCLQANAAARIIVARAEVAPSAAGAAVACPAQAHRAGEVLDIARHVCGEQSRELTRTRADLAAAIARANACESRTTQPAPGPTPQPAPRQVRIPDCYEPSGARVICRDGNTVYEGREECTRRRARLEFAGCACPNGTVPVEGSHYAASLNGFRLRIGGVCLAVLSTGQTTTAGVDLAELSRRYTQIDEHERRLDALCRNEAQCAELRALIDRLRNATVTGGAYDDSELRRLIGGLRGDVNRHEEVLRRICNTTESPTTDNCRPATSNGDTTPPVGGRAPTVRFRPMAGGEIMLLTGQIQLTQVLLGARLSVAASDLIAFYISAGGTAGSYDATGVGSNVGYTIGAGMDFRFALAGMPAVVNLGFAHRGYNATGPRFANTVTEVGVFGDWLGSFYGAELGFSIGLYRGFGVGAHAVLGSGSGLVADQQGRFEVWSGFSYGGGLHLGYNF